MRWGGAEKTVLNDGVHRIWGKMCVLLNGGVTCHSCVALSKSVTLLHFSNNICKLETITHRAVVRVLHAEICKI